MTLVLEVELSLSDAQVASQGAGEECSAAGPAAIGTESRDGPENDRGQIDPTAELCASCGRVHQARETRVPCLECGRATKNYHAVCSRCAAGDAP